MRRKIRCILLAACVAAAALAGCQKGDSAKAVKKEENGQKAEMKNRSKSAGEEATVEGMYMTYGEDGYIFVDTKTRSLFDADIPEEGLYDEEEKQIEKADLHDGDIIACYGNGIVMERYPPKYAAVEKMVRTKSGSRKDTEQYKDLLNDIWHEAEPSEIPYLNVENKGVDAIITIGADQFGYTWSYQDENGEQQTIAVDAPHPLQVENLIDLNCNRDNSDLTLTFSVKPKSVKVTRWAKGTTTEQVDTGTDVDVRLDGRNAFIQNAERTSVYQVNAAWENGEVIYGFYIR